jgi:hypothetical protein
MTPSAPTPRCSHGWLDTLVIGLSLASAAHHGKPAHILTAAELRHTDLEKLYLETMAD